ncbi:methyltransferase [Paractinoplanes lichenicola]|uniref:Methyltransferase domain-containing protein n=1 Tax=Paractinoplanes lichenicola TaxID=2802976 RepID=A0ABS1VZV2_9ACTN|nr:methyltransferase [Actinoplanes lichenicola]MBL7259833.1 methyltransferase domain-containing protein [Actinoplanes lichenicola]
MLTPTPLMGLVTGFWSFKTLAAAVELDLFTKLHNGLTLTVAQAKQELGLPERPADLLLAACASLGLLEKDGDGYRNSPLAEEFLVRGKPYYFGGQVSYCDQRTYLPWHRIGEALRTDRPLTWDPSTQDSMFDTADPEMLESFWGAMYSTSIFTAQALGRAIDLSGRRRLLDVGGGSGAYPIELCRLLPELSATVLDLPHVCEIAQVNIERADLSGRIGTRPGNFLTDAQLPDGHDVVLFSMILHDWDEPTNQELLTKAYAALPPGGLVVISELLLNADRTGPAPAALMGLNMLVETEGGRNYSDAEYAQWLTRAGFTDVRTVHFDAPGANGAVIATKP